MQQAVCKDVPEGENMADRDRLEMKYDQLKDRIASEGKAAIAFSGGVDSVFLLYAAKEALGDQVLALTVSLHAMPEKELREAEEFCKQHQIRHRVETVDEFSIEGFAQNPPNRCYLCKKALFQRMLLAAGEEGFLILMEGSNMDDQGDYRPGLRALRELRIQSPLKDAGFSKAEIREMSRRLSLPSWEKPSMACLWRTNYAGTNEDGRTCRGISDSYGFYTAESTNAWHAGQNRAASRGASSHNEGRNLQESV